MKCFEKKNIFFVEEKTNGEGKGGEYLKRKMYFLRRRGKTKKEGKYIFYRGEENRVGKGGKYLEKENIFFDEEKQNGEGKGGK